MEPMRIERLPTLLLAMLLLGNGASWPLPTTGSRLASAHAGASPGACCCSAGACAMGSGRACCAAGGSCCAHHGGSGRVACYRCGCCDHAAGVPASPATSLPAVVPGPLASVVDAASPAHSRAELRRAQALRPPPDPPPIGGRSLLSS